MQNGGTEGAPRGDGPSLKITQLQAPGPARGGHARAVLTGANYVTSQGSKCIG
jgi:hypothetical protein